TLQFSVVCMPRAPCSLFFPSTTLFRSAEARRRGCRWVEGLAAECAAELLEARNLTLFADGARRRAWQAYALWGASAKLEQLRQRSEEHTSELQSRENLVCRLLLEKKKK